MLTKVKISEIIMDFDTGPDNERIDLCSDKRHKDFWDWFEKKAVSLEICDSPNPKLIDNSNIISRCFGNSQILTIKNSLDYYEGFVKIHENYILHGFNVNNGKVQDYTVLSNPKDFKDCNDTLENEYYGIKIDRKFIEKHNYQDIKNENINISPLLEKFYDEEMLHKEF